MIMNYKIKIPDGCKVMNVEVTNNRIVLEVEKEEPKFKENDIIVIDEYTIAILENRICDSVFYNVKTHINIIDSKLFISESTLSGKCRLATDSEKQLLFDKLKEKCLMFDGKDIVRWRAEQYQKYFYLPGDGDIAETKDDMSNWDDMAYYIGNYFPTREMAKSFQKQYIELLNNFHKNLE